MSYEAFSAVRRAKMKVAFVFKALEALGDTAWRELVQGGWEARASIVGGTLTAYVGENGTYSVYVGKHEERRITLLSGVFEEAREDVSAGQANEPDASRLNPAPCTQKEGMDAPSFLKERNLSPGERERLHRQEPPESGGTRPAGTSRPSDQAPPR